MIVGPATFERLCRARELLDGAATIDAVAEAVGVSPFHLTRLFTALFGATPRQYRTHRRIDRAKELLAAGTSVTDACLAVGFTSVGSFSALFARRVGESPSAYGVRMRGTRAPGCLALFASA